MEATLLQSAGAADHFVKKQETASLGDRVAASTGARVVGGATGDLTDAIVVRCMTGKPALRADAAEGRADARARRGVNSDAARRVEAKSAARWPCASVHAIESG